MWNCIEKIFSWFGKKKAENEQVEEFIERSVDDEEEQEEFQTLADTVNDSGIVVYKKRLPEVPGEKKREKLLSMLLTKSYSNP